MTAPHTAALDHALAEALHTADAVRFRHDAGPGPDLAYSAEATKAGARFTAMAASPIEALGMAMRMLTTALQETRDDR